MPPCRYERRTMQLQPNIEENLQDSILFQTARSWVDVVHESIQPCLRTYRDVLVLPGLDALYTRDGYLIETSQRVTVPTDVASPAEVARVQRGYGKFAQDMVKSSQKNPSPSAKMGQLPTP
jgi:hypothetical protein